MHLQTNPDNNVSKNGQESTSTEEIPNEQLRTSTPSLLSDLQIHSTEVRDKFLVFQIILNSN